MGKDGPGNNRKQWTQLSSSLTALGPQPSFPILLSRVLLVAWAGTRGGRGGPGSGRLEAEFNSSTGWFESFPYIWSTSKEQGKKRSYSDSCPLPLSVLKHVDWMHFHEAESCQQSLQIWRVCPWISAHKMSLVHSGGHALFFSHSTPILITAPRLHYEELPPPTLRMSAAVVRHIRVPCPSPAQAHHPEQSPPPLLGLWVSNIHETHPERIHSRCGPSEAQFLSCSFSSMSLL